jgi:hypothetical protein
MRYPESQLNEKIELEDKDFADVTDFGATFCKLAVDATECILRRPQDKAINDLFYSGKKEAHTIKYESN